MTSFDPNRLDAVLLDLPARTKADVLKLVAARAAALTGLDPAAVVRALGDREKLGSTGVGSGVALPHAGVAGLRDPMVIFSRPAAPIDWEAIDDRPVDLVLAVLTPARTTGASLNVLSRYARVLRSEETRARLRGGGEAEVAEELATRLAAGCGG